MPNRKKSTGGMILKIVRKLGGKAKRREIIEHFIKQNYTRIYKKQCSDITPSEEKKIKSLIDTTIYRLVSDEILETIRKGEYKISKIEMNESKNRTKPRKKIKTKKRTKLAFFAGGDAFRNNFKPSQLQ